MTKKASTVTGSIGVASLRPTFLQSFFDRFHITLESYFTGSRSQDVTHRLSPEELERHSKAVDHMYEDFKTRVCEGRGIDKEVIEGIAGGRVMTGLKAFGLTAPEGLIREIKGEGEEATKEGEKEKIDSVTTDESKKTEDSTVMESPLEKVEEEKSVQLAQDQETSPFSPVEEPSTSSPSSPLPSADVAATPTGPTSPEAHVEDALRTSTLAEQIPNSELKKSNSSALTKSRPATTGGANNGVSGEYTYEPGPYGRGLVDGLGGLRDAAIYACQLFVRSKCFLSHCLGTKTDEVERME